MESGILHQLDKLNTLNNELQQALQHDANQDVVAA